MNSLSPFFHVIQSSLQWIVCSIFSVSVLKISVFRRCLTLEEEEEVWTASEQTKERKKEIEDVSN